MGVVGAEPSIPASGEIAAGSKWLSFSWNRVAATRAPDPCAIVMVSSSTNGDRVMESASNAARNELANDSW